MSPVYVITTVPTAPAKKSKKINLNSKIVKRAAFVAGAVVGCLAMASVIGKTTDENED